MPDQDHDCFQAERIAIMETYLSDIRGDLKELLGTIRGNGQPGLKTDVELLKDNLKRLRNWGMALFSGTGLLIIGYLVKGMVG